MNILIVKIAAIGDVIMALPMIEAIKNEKPDARITWLCGKTVAPLLEAVHEIDEIIVVDEQKLLAGSLGEKLHAMFIVWKRLLGRRFDLVVTGYTDCRYRLLSLTARGKERRNFGYKNKRLWPVPSRHHSNEYVRLITKKDSPGAVHSPLPIFDYSLPDNLKSELNLGDSPVVALAPGGAKNVMRDDEIRRWPLEHYTALVDRLISKGIKVIITGSYSDRWIHKSFADLDVVDLIGKTSLTDLIALYKKCNLIVSHDSSPVHLAALAGKPVMALFGPTNPYEKIPRNNHSVLFWGGEHLACRPCYDGKTYLNCSQNLCMQDIKTEMVYEAIVSFLEKHSTH